jgi:hypothetical protein
MGLVVWLASWMPLEGWPLLSTQIVGGVIAYSLFSFLFHREAIEDFGRVVAIPWLVARRPAGEARG